MLHPRPARTFRIATDHLLRMYYGAARIILILSVALDGLAAHHITGSLIVWLPPAALFGLLFGVPVLATSMADAEFRRALK
jgi:hypothetical protein